MGWSIGYDENWQRDIGYGVPAYCDHPECGKEIDRGLSFVCGGEPYGGDEGCGLFFCGKHVYLGVGNSQLCAKCCDNEESFEPTPDHPEWTQHKLTDESWRQWREENPGEVLKLNLTLKRQDNEEGVTEDRIEHFTARSPEDIKLAKEVINIVMNNEQIARVAHEVNRAYCEAIGDDSQVVWEEAPGWQRESAVNGVAFHRGNPDATPESSHGEWLKLKKEEGWSYGPVKNTERKEHPCFLPFDKLPISHKAKDFIFRGVVKSLISKKCAGCS